VIRYVVKNLITPSNISESPDGIPS